MPCISFHPTFRHTGPVTILLALALASAARGQTVSQMVDGGVSYLLDHMVDDPGDANALPDHWAPEAGFDYEAALTPFCAEALLAGPGYDQSQPRKDAVARATRYLLDHRADGTELSTIHALRYLLRLQRSACVPCEMEEEVKEEIQFYINTNQNAMSGNPVQKGYFYSPPHDGQASFYTAPALLYLKEAQDLGYAVNLQTVNDSLDSLMMARIPACASRSGERPA